MTATSELSEVRRRAAQLFKERGFPTMRDEDWRFTAVTPIVKADFPNAAPAVSGPSLRTALERDPETIEQHLGRYADPAQNAFVALNTANFEDGAFINVPRNTAVDDPIRIEFTGVEGRATHPRNLIVVGANSHVRIVERYSGRGRYFTNAVTEIVAGENAIVEHVKLEEESTEAFHVATLQIKQARGSNVTSHNICFGGALVRNDLNSVLATGSECTLNGLYLIAGRQHVDNHSAIDHAEPYANSHELYKGIVDGRSSAVFNGKILVRKDAQKTDAKQTNKNLVLSEEAVINTKPELQIFADDVRCTHGATVGQLDEDALFYLRARGIPRQEARELLIFAFARDIIDRIGIEEVRDYLEKGLFERLVIARHGAAAEAIS